MTALVTAMIAWVMMVNPANVDSAMDMQRSQGLDPYGSCFIHEDGSGQCEGITFPAYDDFMHYTR